MTFDVNTLLDILKASVGLVYLYLEYHARPSMWIASIIMPAIGLWLYWNKGLYGDCAINLYYLLIAVYGFLVWTRKSHGAKGETKQSQPIAHIRPLAAAVLAFVFLFMWGAIAYLLHRYTPSNVVLLDSFTTSLSIIGMWMLARKYVEQWFVWFVVDAIYVGLYYKKGIYFSGVALYTFYTVMALVGYRKWTRMMCRQQQPS